MDMQCLLVKSYDQFWTAPYLIVIELFCRYSKKKLDEFQTRFSFKAILDALEVVYEYYSPLGDCKASF